MKKVLLISGMALCFGSVMAQSKIVYENWTTHRLHYWTDNQDAMGTTLYASDAASPTDASETVGKFERKMNDKDGLPKQWTIITTGVTCDPIDPADPGAWCTIDMATYPFISMNVYAADSMKIKINIKDKTTTLDVANRDVIYGYVNGAVKANEWQNMVFDFSSVAGPEWGDNMEMQIFFSHGVARDITVYFDDVVGGKSMADVVGIKNADDNVAEVLQNAPNPTSNVTNIAYSLKGTSKVSLKVYNMLGNEVATLINGKQAAGNYSLPYDVSSLANGVYYYALSVGGSVQTKKLIKN